jgi:hypothetical protein
MLLRVLRLLLAAVCVSHLPAAGSIAPADVPTFTFSCRVTSSLDAPSPAPPLPPPRPSPPAPNCTLQACKPPQTCLENATCGAAPTETYNFNLGCSWVEHCAGLAGVAVGSTGTAWSQWSPEYTSNISTHALNTLKCYPNCFFKTYATLAVEMGLRSNLKDDALLNLMCAIRFTGKDAGQSTRIEAQVQNSNATTRSAAVYAGTVGLMLGRLNATEPSSGALVQTYAQVSQLMRAFWAKLAQKLVPPTSAFYSYIPTGVHGPTCIFWANITPFSLQFNRARYWSKLANIPTPPHVATKFPIVDTFDGDSDLASHADAADAFARMGINVNVGAEAPGY